MRKRQEVRDMAVYVGRQELSPALRAQRVALVAAARAELAAEKEAALTGAAPTDGRTVEVAPVRAGRAAEAASERAPTTERERSTSTAPSSRSSVQDERPARTTGGDSSAVERRRSTTEVAGSRPAPRSRAAALEERDSFLARTHGELTPQQQADELGLEYGTVIAARQRLAARGLIAIRRAGPRHEWTAEDDQQLRDRIGTVPHEQLAAELGTNLAGLLLRSKRLGISRRDARKVTADHWNAYDVARILAVDEHAITHQFIPWGLLRAKRHEWLHAHGTSRRGEGATMQWTIRRQDVVEFLIDYPWQYDRERITDPFFRRVADEAWNRDPLYTSEEAGRLLGFKGEEPGKSFIHLVQNTLPKIMERRLLVLRRRGNPRNAGRSLAGSHVFVHRSTLRAIQRSGWINFKTVAADTEHPTVEMAAKLLYEREDRPEYITRSVLAERLRRLYKSGAIPTREVKLVTRRPWLIARSRQDLEPLLPYLFARTNFSARLTHHHRALLERHEPELLREPRALALAQATGELTHRLLDYYEQERRAEREFRLGGQKRVVFVAPDVARTLELLGNRTRYVGRRRGAAYHLQRCVRRLVAIPLKEARRHALRLCAHCDVVAKERARGRTHQPVLVACSSCGDAFARPVGRPSKTPRCERCRATRPLRRAA